MLIIKREAGEAIHIGDDTVIRVLSIEHGRVRLGIEAPKSVEVQRVDRDDEGPDNGAEGGRRGGCTGLYRRGRIRHQA